MNQVTNKAQGAKNTLMLFGLVLLLFIGSTHDLQAAPGTIIVTDRMDLSMVTNQLETLANPDDKLDFDALLSESDSDRFKRIDADSVAKLKGKTWYRGVLENPTTHPISIYLQFDLFSHVHLGVYPLDGSPPQPIQESGWNMAFAKRPLRFLQPTFEVFVPPGISRLVIRSEGAIFSMRAGSIAAVSDSSIDFEMCFVFFLATFLALGFYNFFIYTRTLDRAYLYYSLRCIIIAVHGGVAFFFIPKHLLPNIVYNHHSISLSLAGINSVIWLILTRKFISLDQFIAKRFLNGSMIALCTGLILGVIHQNYQDLAEPVGLLRAFQPLSLLWMLGAGIYACTKGYRPAFFFVPAVAIYFLGIFVVIFMMEGGIQAHPFNYLAPSLSGAIEAILMAFGLGDKYMMYMKAAQNRLNDKNIELGRDLSVMMQSLDQGIFTVDLKGTISSEHSAYLKVLLGQDDLAGKDAFSLIFKGTDSLEDEIDTIRNATIAGIGEDRLTFDFNCHALPREITRLMGNVKHIWEVDWQPLLDKNEKCEKVMVVLRDVSDLRQLQDETEKRHRDLKIAAQVMSMSVSTFQKFARNTSELINQNIQHIENRRETMTLDIALLFRNVHTIKGNSRTFGLLFISDMAHEVENYFTDIRTGKVEVPDPLRLLSDMRALQATFGEYNAVVANFLKVGVDENNPDLMEALNELYRSGASEDEVKDRFFALAVDQRIKRFYPSLNEILDPILKSQTKMAEELSKPSPNIAIEGSTVRVSVEMEPILRNIFTQILRNSVDHGIESPTQRLAEGKQYKGAINVVIDAKVKSGLVIEVQDDGAGLNMLALAKKLKDPNQSDESIANTIFLTGVSTAEKITHISGRGVGMDIIKDLVAKHGGSIEIVFTKPKTERGRRPFKLVFTFPARYVLDAQNESMKIAS